MDMPPRRRPWILEPGLGIGPLRVVGWGASSTECRRRGWRNRPTAQASSLNIHRPLPYGISVLEWRALVLLARVQQGEA